MVRKVLQVLAGLLGWVVFALLWWLAFRQRGFEKAIASSLVVISVFAALLVIAASSWVAWNVFLSKKQRAGEHIPEGAHDYSCDVAGRPVRADFAELKSRRYIVVDLEDGAEGTTKVYTPADEALSGEEQVICRLP